MDLLIGIITMFLMGVWTILKIVWWLWLEIIASCIIFWILSSIIELGIHFILQTLGIDVGVGGIDIRIKNILSWIITILILLGLISLEIKRFTIHR